MSSRKYLHVFEGVRIPVDLASTQTYALLAKRDGGKTYTTLLFEEQLCDAGLYFVTLDPVGKHWAIRAGADGSPDGGKRDVFVLGGLHGDVPLEPTAGELIADVVIEHPGRYVLDTTLFDTEADQDRFADAFGKRLMRRKMRSPGWPLTVIMEEAESFIPERPQPGQARMLGTYGKMMRHGRNFGIGMWLVAQRTAAINKGVLSQAEVLVVKQMAHNRDIEAVRAWVKANGTPEQELEMTGQLAQLRQNEAYVWSPSWLRVYARTRVPKRVTFDASASVKGGVAAVDVQLTPLDVAALGEQIARTAERARAEDPTELRKRVAELERDRLALDRKLQALQERQERQVEPRVVVPFSGEELDQAIEYAEGALTRADGARDRLEQTLRDAENIVAGAEYVFDAVRGWRRRLDEQNGALDRLEHVAVGNLITRGASVARLAADRAPGSPERLGEKREVVATSARQGRESSPGPAAQSNGRVQLKAGARRMLHALASMHPAWLTRAQVGTLSKIKHTGGTFGSYLSALRTGGLIEERGAELRITDAGFAVLGSAAPAPATTEELLAMWRDRLKKGAREMLDALVASYPKYLTREQLAAAAGIEPSGGTFGSYLSMLRRTGLVEEDGKLVRAAATLFLADG